MEKVKQKANYIPMPEEMAIETCPEVRSIFCFVVRMAEEEGSCDNDRLPYTTCRTGPPYLSYAMSKKYESY
jgi:hypothetical protein